MTPVARNTAILAAGQALNAMAGGFIYPFFSVYMLEHDQGAAAVGAVFAGATLLSAVGRAVGGELADRSGRRAVAVRSVFARSLLLAGVGALVTAGAGITAVAAAFLASNVARGTYEPASDAMIADMVPPPGRPRAYALMRVARNAGWAAGPVLGGLAGADHFAWLSCGAAALGFVYLGLLVGQLSETRATAPLERFHPRELALVWRDRAFRHHCLLTAGLFVLFAQLLVSISVDLAGRARLSSLEIGWAYTLNGLMVVFLQAPITRAISGRRAGAMLALGALADGAGYLVIGGAAHLPLGLVGMAIVTTGEMITLPLSASLAADLAPAGRRGRYLGAYGVFVDGGHGSGQVVGGLGLEWAGPHPLRFWWALVAFSAFVAAGYWRFDARPRRS